MSSNTSNQKVTVAGAVAAVVGAAIFVGAVLVGIAISARVMAWAQDQAGLSSASTVVRYVVFGAIAAAPAWAGIPLGHALAMMRERQTELDLRTMWAAAIFGGFFYALMLIFLMLMFGQTPTLIVAAILGGMAGFGVVDARNRTGAEPST